MLRRIAAALLVTCGAAGPLPAGAQRYWDRSFTPFAYYSTTDGFWVAGWARFYSPVIGTAERPEPHLAWVELRGGASTEGSHFIHAEAQAPAWWDGWRLALSLDLERRNRYGYYGLGNETFYSSDSTRAGRPYFYRVSRSLTSARVTVQRRVAGPVRVLVGGVVSRTDYRGLPGETVFERDAGSGAIDPGEIPFADAAWRTGLVLDTRDHEVDPHRGALVEALYGSGRGYRRITGSARVWVQPARKVVLLARAAGERATGALPLAALGELEASADPIVAVGGYRSLRGYPEGRFTGPGKILAGIELRYAVFFVPPYEVKVFGFYDAGRVFAAGEEFRVTTDGLHSGGGAGVAARLGRNAILVLGAGFTGEGWQLLLDTRWSY